ncbi:hypothetical protein [Methanoculleus bourgensis]|jgi:hypothetical protein|uniref:Uncharacterized protein n=1 Tax=Methanoculleus bourgensis TaxID=83986 RepID=A0A0X3BK44_9EURY|nr:hypothetical protein [Methanoculleus bourgensis]CVK32333.1 conserved exported protein of unknown function [Methanoculleus bourgensis]
MKLHIYSCIATIILVVLASAGCLGPAGTAVNATPEPTPEPCETCTVPEDFCGPPGVCLGEPVNDVYAFTDKNVYRIGEVVEFGIVNCGDERKAFSPFPWVIQKWVTNASGFTYLVGYWVVGNCTGGMWETIGVDGWFSTGETMYLNPGENWTMQWNTTDWWETAKRGGDHDVVPFQYRMRSDGSSYQISDDPLAPGIYRVWYDKIWYDNNAYNNASKEFEFV